MKIAIIGSGYVGLVTGACLADVGHEVICVDRDESKVRRLQQGDVDIYEPGLPELIQRGMQQGTLRFTCQMAEALSRCQAVFIAVATPASSTGAADLSQVLAVANSIGTTIKHYTVVICKSTVPVGTCESVRQTVRQCLAERGATTDFDVVSNPEFLKEGAAVNDFMRPHRVVIGSDSERAVDIMRAIYAPFVRKQERFMVMDIASSEMTKYVANAMLATKISFINEISRLAEKTGADIEHIRRGIGSDPRIGYEFIYAGCGYGGSCFPKDIQAIVHTGRMNGCNMQLLQAVDAVNRSQRHVMIDHLRHHFSHDLSGKTIAIWGLSFKPETDDIREAPSLYIIEQLLSIAVRVQVYDPVAMPAVRAHFGRRNLLIYADTRQAALLGTDALLICTEWKAFRVLDAALLHSTMNTPVVIDGRNLYDPEQLRREGITYYGIGRGESLKKSVKTTALHAVANSPVPRHISQDASANTVSFHKLSTSDALLSH